MCDCAVSRHQNAPQETFLIGGASRLDVACKWGMVRPMRNQPSAVTWCVLALALLLAGCASPTGRWSGAGRNAPGAQPVQPASPVAAKPGPAPAGERDGPPPAAEAPSVAELAAQPDPVPQVEPIRQGGPNKPYTVLGENYEPLTRDVPLKERGMASWYGRKFHGRRTASGEVFNMYGLSAAHRTLPIPSYARVTDVKTGKAIIVRINDRGPFHSARVMDLSYGAAVKLGVAARGSAEIEFERLTFDEIRTGAWRRDGDTAVAEGEVMQVTGAGALAANVAAVAQTVPLATPVVTPKSAVSPPAAPAVKAFTPFQRGYWVQLAALGQRESVERMQQRVAAELSALEPLLAVFHEAPYFKLQVGPYGSREEAVAAADQARAALSVSPMVIERR
jgi:rare lipoprotein A